MRALALGDYNGFLTSMKDPFLNVDFLGEMEFTTLEDLASYMSLISISSLSRAEVFTIKFKIINKKL